MTASIQVVALLLALPSLWGMERSAWLAHNKGALEVSAGGAASVHRYRMTVAEADGVPIGHADFLFRDEKLEEIWIVGCESVQQAGCRDRWARTKSELRRALGPPNEADNCMARWLSSERAIILAEPNLVAAFRRPSLLDGASAIIRGALRSCQQSGGPAPNHPPLDAKDACALLTTLLNSKASPSKQLRKMLSECAGKLPLVWPVLLRDGHAEPMITLKNGCAIRGYRVLTAEQDAPPESDGLAITLRSENEGFVFEGQMVVLNEPQPKDCKDCASVTSVPCGVAAGGIRRAEGVWVVETLKP